MGVRVRRGKSLEGILNVLNASCRSPFFGVSADILDRRRCRIPVHIALMASATLVAPAGELSAARARHVTQLAPDVSSPRARLRQNAGHRCRHRPRDARQKGGMISIGCSLKGSMTIPTCFISSIERLVFMTPSMSPSMIMYAARFIRS